MKATEQESEYRTVIEELRKELSSQKREGERINRALRDTEDELKSKQHVAQIAAERGEKHVARQEQEVEELRKDLAKEKQRTHETEKSLRRAHADWEIEKSALEERLDTVRTKLKSHKEQLKRKIEELRQAQMTASNAAKSSTNLEDKRGTKNSRKRGIQQVDPDAAIGTPGIPEKRNKRASTAQPGDKSTFSITPFLNRTASVASSPASEQSVVSRAEIVGVNEVVDSIENEQSPTILRKKQPAISKSSRNPRALAPLSSNRPISKRAPPKSAVPPRLEKVAEEDDQENEDENRDTEVAQPLELSKVQKITLKPKSNPSRRSLMSFSSFTEDPAPEKRRKRKLGGAIAANKTLFDEDDQPSLKPTSGKGSLAAKAIVRGGLLAKGAGKPGLTVLEDGFMFSPLKRDRRAIAAK